MIKLLVRTMIVFFGLVAMGGAARGQAVDQLVVNIPYEFVVAGQTLPAGNYRINRLAGSNERELVIGGIENRDSVMVYSTDAERRVGAPHLTFQLVGDQHLLSKIETGEHVFTIPVYKSTVLEAGTKAHCDPSLMPSGGSRSK
jgi:hypothetical protein